MSDDVTHTPPLRALELLVEALMSLPVKFREPEPLCERISQIREAIAAISDRDDLAHVERTFLRVCDSGGAPFALARHLDLFTRALGQALLMAIEVECERSKTTNPRDHE